PFAIAAAAGCGVTVVAPPPGGVIYVTGNGTPYRGAGVPNVPGADVYQIQTNTGVTVSPGVEPGYAITAQADGTYRLVWAGDTASRAPTWSTPRPPRTAAPTRPPRPTRSASAARGAHAHPRRAARHRRKTQERGRRPGRARRRRGRQQGRLLGDRHQDRLHHRE